MKISDLRSYILIDKINFNNYILFSSLALRFYSSKKPFSYLFVQILYISVMVWLEASQIYSGYEGLYEVQGWEA